MARTVIIADDITGANDIGIMYAKSGLTTLVYSWKEEQTAAYQECDVLILDTDSRFDTAEEAYRKVRRVLARVDRDHVDQFISKQCSVFRGNIGAEFDAMLDYLDAEFAAVVLGFPDNGRATLHSRHYVFGVPLAESQFRNDPVHPMRQSDLVGILQSQTSKRVGSIHYEVYDRGAEAVRAALDDARSIYNYCIMDVRNNKDLQLLAEVLRTEKVICGSSALSEYLAPYDRCGEASAEPEQVKKNDKIFCMAGSLTPQTAGQIAYMKEKGYPVFQLDTRSILRKEERETEYERMYKAVSEAYQKNRFVMIYSMNLPEQVAETKAAAQRLGISNTQVSSLVSSVLSDIACAVMGAYRIERFIVCGGDTSAALCARLDVEGMQVLKEIEPGLPTCRSVMEPYYHMVLKSGSFGSREFIEKAIEKL